jgi:hypothetical protein
VLAAHASEARIGAHGGYGGSAVDLFGFLGELGYELDPFETAEIEAGRRNENAPTPPD